MVVVDCLDRALGGIKVELIEHPCFQTVGGNSHLLQSWRPDRLQREHTVLLQEQELNCEVTEMDLGANNDN